MDGTTMERCEACGSAEILRGVDADDREDGTYVCEDCEHEGRLAPRLSQAWTPIPDAERLALVEAAYYDVYKGALLDGPSEPDVREALERFVLELWAWAEDHVRALEDGAVADERAEIPRRVSAALGALFAGGDAG
jgi:hypothetical protein